METPPPRLASERHSPYFTRPFIAFEFRGLPGRPFRPDGAFDVGFLQPVGQRGRGDSEALAICASEVPRTAGGPRQLCPIWRFTSSSFSLDGVLEAIRSNRWKVAEVQALIPVKGSPSAVRASYSWPRLVGLRRSCSPSSSPSIGSGSRLRNQELHPPC